MLIKAEDLSKQCKEDQKYFKRFLKSGHYCPICGKSESLKYLYGVKAVGNALEIKYWLNCSCGFSQHQTYDTLEKACIILELGDERKGYDL